MLTFIQNLAAFIVVIGILVTIHEYGHFWVARRNGVKVERFSIGFGKKIWSRTDRLGTEYVIAAIPLGGYVKMLDERVDDVAEEDLPHAFNRKTVWQRIAIVSAGPAANFIFAIFAFYLMYLIGVPATKPVIENVTENSVAAQANLKQGMVLTDVAGSPVRTWQDVQLAIVGNIGKDQITIQAKPEGQASKQSFTINLQGVTFSPEKESPFQTLGISPLMAKVTSVVSSVADDSGAQRAGIIKGDKLIAIDGEKVEDDWRAIVEFAKRSADVTTSVTVSRNGELIDLPITLTSVEENGTRVGRFGFAPSIEQVPEKYRFKLQYGILEAAKQGVAETWKFTTLSFNMIGKFFTGDLSVKNLSGPVSIAQGAGNSASGGIVHFLYFLAVISISLGIINILPLPVLDGGHLLYYLIELLTGKPLPEKVQEAGFRIGAILLLALMSLALFNDMSRL